MHNLIRRYSVHVRGDCLARGCNPYLDVEESAEGVWVDYDEHVRLVERLQAEMDRIVLRSRDSSQRRET